MIYPKQGRWIARPHKPPWLWRTAALVLLLILYLLEGITEPFLNEPWANVLRWSAVVVVPGVGCWLWWQEKYACSMAPEDHTLVDGAFGDQFAVEMTLVVERKRLGTDRGVVWFSEGLMGFSGKASSFVLAASNLAAEWDESKRHITGKHLPPGPLVLVGTPKLAHVIVAPLRGHGEGYRERLRRFVAANELPEGERYWPPLFRYADVPPIIQPAVGS